MDNKTNRFTDVSKAVWLIKQDRSLTLEEKHKAWTEIIATMPDCAFISEDYPEANIDSVRTFLSEYVNLENRLLKQFKKKSQTPSIPIRFGVTEIRVGSARTALFT